MTFLISSTTSIEDSSEVPAADRVADLLRRQMTEGLLLPDDRLKDQELASRFDVSRTTAREALRILASEGLVASKLHIGSTVRRLGVEDIHDIYTTRRVVECAAVQTSDSATDDMLAALVESVEKAEDLVKQGEWSLVGTASLEFHGALVGLAGSRALNNFFRQVLAQLRLAFSSLPEDKFQPAWVSRDRAVLDLILSGERAAAIMLLDNYLADSRATVIDGVRAAARAKKQK